MIKEINKNNVVKRILIILIMVVIIINFTINNYSFATDMDEEGLSEIIQNIIGSVPEEEEEEGGELFTPISQFILGIADGVMATMQAAFLGDEKGSNLITSNAIKKTTPGDETDGSSKKGATIYAIQYSPAAIFSGRIPAFDINFFDPMGDENGKTEFSKLETTYTAVGNMTYENCRQNYGATNNLQSIRDNISLTEIIAHGLALICAVNAIEALANNDSDVDYMVDGLATAVVSVPIITPDLNAVAASAIFTAGAIAAEGIALTDRLKDQNIYYMQWEYDGITYFFISDDEAWKTGSEREQLQGTLYKVGYTVATETYEKTSTAFTLRPVISKWYYALRQFALVGLLSVLLYVGIRILISSTAQDKSKYKKMLADWITAVCILFVLHFIMTMIIKITQELTDIFVVSNIEPDGTDKFVTNIRNMITGNNNDSYFQYFGYVILYLAITILTVTFTIQYIQRLVMIAFLTMIAPLIALTYPLDKIKDGQAQAFTIWLREYVFNCLLQPLHLLLYTIFISSASSLVNINPVYAVITLAFFTPAEKFIRKMFGFEKASTVGILGSATGGAMVMNMLNKLQGKNTKGKASETEKTNKVRMVDNKNSSKETLTQSGDTAEKNQIVNQNNTNSNSKKVQGVANNNYNARNGLREVNKRHLFGVDSLKSKGKWVAKTAAKTAGAFAGATIGLASGVASGNLGDTAKYTGAGAIAGANAVTNLNNKIENTASNIYKTYKEGYTKEEQSGNNGQGMEEDIYHEVEQDSKIGQKGIDERMETKEFVDNGITNPEEIKSALKSGITGNEYKNYIDSGIETLSEMVALRENGISGNEYKDYSKQGITKVEKVIEAKREQITANDIKEFSSVGQNDVNKILNAKRKHPTYSKDQMKNMFQLAKNSPRTLPEFKSVVLNRNFDGIKLNENDAEKIFKELQDFF